MHLVKGCGTRNDRGAFQSFQIDAADTDYHPRMVASVVGHYLPTAVATSCHTRLIQNCAGVHLATYCENNQVQVAAWEAEERLHDSLCEMVETEEASPLDSHNWCSVLLEDSHLEQNRKRKFGPTRQDSR